MRAIPELTLNDGTALPALGLGTYKLTGAARAAAMRGAIARGTGCSTPGPTTSTSRRRRRSPSALRLVLEPGRRALGSPAHGWAHPNPGRRGAGLGRGRAAAARHMLPPGLRCGRRSPQRTRQAFARSSPPGSCPSALKPIWPTISWAS